MKRERRARLWWLILVPAVVCLLPGHASADAGDPPARVARVSYLQGKVSLQPAGENQWSEVSLNYPMTTNDRLYTDQGARAELDIGTAALRLSEATDLTLANLNDAFMQLGLEQGTLRVSVYQLPSGTSIEIDTPNGALTVLQAGHYRVETFPNSNATLVSVDDGSLQLSGGGLTQRVSTGQAVKLTGTAPVQATFVSLPVSDSFDQWSSERDQYYTAAPSLRRVSRAIPGYYDLDAYGAWSELPDYGPVWFPTVVVGWAPYRFGRWVWVWPWGWTWIEDEPWGFAPFHYGRWVYMGFRWGWLPGPVVSLPYYAPACVAFVGGPNLAISLGFRPGGVAAWFPLGPREPFFPWYHYGSAYLRQVNVTNARDVVNVASVTNMGQVHFVNQRIATTVVPSGVFSSGQSVQNRLIRVNASQLAKAQIVPHPRVNPTAGSVFAGRPAVPSPVGPARFGASEGMGRKMLTPGASASSAPQEIRRPLVTRTPPASGSVPFEAQQKAMSTHPGRPLEPQQLQNLRTGRPAGPMRDREFPSHPAEPSGRPPSSRPLAAPRGARHP